MNKRDLKAALNRARDIYPVTKRNGGGWRPLAGDIRFAEAALDRGDPHQMTLAYRRLKRHG